MLLIGCSPLFVLFFPFPPPFFPLFFSVLFFLLARLYRPGSPYLLNADWCLQSDDVTDSRLLARALLSIVQAIIGTNVSTVLVQGRTGSDAVVYVQ